MPTIKKTKRSFSNPVVRGNLDGFQDYYDFEHVVKWFVFEDDDGTKMFFGVIDNDGACMLCLPNLHDYVASDVVRMMEVLNSGEFERL